MRAHGRSALARWRTEGHAVRVCHDGLAAMQLATQRPPDVAFLDIGMPGLDGYALARRLRGEPASRGVTLVAVTGWGQEADRARVREAGFDDHWVKPIDVAQALVMLRDVAARKSSPVGSWDAQAGGRAPALPP